MAIFVCLLACAAGAEEDQRAPRDAAELVREGDVSQWLKHYERERRALTGNLREDPPQQGQPAPKDEKKSEPMASEPRR